MFSRFSIDWEIFVCYNSRVEPCVAQGHHPHGILPQRHAVYDDFVVLLKFICNQ
jgi:hypothetical protein